MILFAAGLGLLLGGGECLVRGASRLAAAAGISPLVIGLTVVAFGTSSPEMAVSTVSALSGNGGADIAIGNIVGSNIFNILFILGISAMVAPLAVSAQLVKWDVPIMIGVSVLFLVLASNGRIDRIDGILLFSGIIAYTVFTVWKGSKENSANQPGEGQSARLESGRGRALMLNLLLIAAGLALLVIGSKWMVDGAVQMAKSLGVSELVISLTIVAVGTSLPELATSVLATFKGERDIAVGNVIGSNLFNILCVAGFSGAVVPGGIAVSPAALAFDIPVMIAVAAACLPIFFSGFRIDRLEGFLFLACYVAYTAWLVLTALNHPALPGLDVALRYLVLPVTALLILIPAIRQFR
ncbi:MAG: sodium:calcium antiporter [Desulfobacteraceae bacterium]|jgi:cation:H+ antiporter|nr:MAG: sodium:calcium antiporter [Desulfobacteraceae bacterium]